MRDKGGEPFMIALDTFLKQHNRLERMVSLAESALREVLEWIPHSPNSEIQVYLGVPEYGPVFNRRDAATLIESLANALGDACSARIQAVPDGNTAGIVGLQQALSAINKSEADCCIVGGVDSFVDPDLLESLDFDGRVLSTSNRWGFPPGEAAGMLAVCSTGFVERHKLSVLSFVASTSITTEENRINTETICVGEGLGAALAAAAASSGYSVGTQYCDLNGERYREREFSYAVLRVPPNTFIDALDYVAPVDSWGHTGAATFPLLALIPVVRRMRGFDTGRRTMVWCGSESGRRGAVVLDSAG